MRYPLSPFQQRLILSACPSGTRIPDAVPVRETPVACPLWVHVAPPGGAQETLVLRIDRDPDGVRRALEVLA